MMGVADLREAFNAVASPRYTASAAFLSMERTEGAEWSRLRFSGIGSDGSAFDVVSDLVPAGADIIQAARKTAQRLIDPPPPVAPAEELPT